MNSFDSSRSLRDYQLKAEYSAPNADVRQDVITRWGGISVLLRNGFVPVATTFLWNGARLGLKPLENLLIIHLMSYKRSRGLPRPSYAKLAERVGISAVHCRRVLRSLEARGFLIRVPSQGGNSSFDMTPLFTKLARLIDEQDTLVERQRWEASV
jgi:hypothetical protein